jgi:DNA-binding response OmpR family regulator
MNILIVEDERMLRDSIKEYLEAIGHIVKDYSAPKEAMCEVSKDIADLIILDINLPEKNGFDLLKSIREIGVYTPIIYISALIDIEDITKGFSLGCADYIKKPFHLKELVLRIENVMKIKKSYNHILLTKNYSYDRVNKTLLYQNRPCELTKRQLQIVNLLASNIGIVVDFEKFREFIYANESIDNATIRAEVSRLKKSLKENFIDNIRGIGYTINRY